MNCHQTGCEERQLLAVVERAFRLAHDGYSVDEVLICNRLNRRFIQCCLNELPDAAPVELNWALLNLRKTGQLGAVATRRIRVCYSEILHVAEIAARHMQDRYDLNVDRILCDPDHLAEFDRIAMGVAPGVSSYIVRKAALKLRKTRKLRPELVPRLTDSWGRRVFYLHGGDLVEASNTVPRCPGIYIFIDPSGYLYIGEASNLRRRIRKHLDHSDSKSLARHLWRHGYRDIQIEIHAFSPESDARLVKNRRAYESDLIASRNPRFNIKP
ncbi:GIY-YIG nuclease family protein [bacterium]|nr:GIY-YIG nuclease family protein [bacterium]